MARKLVKEAAPVGTYDHARWNKTKMATKSGVLLVCFCFDRCLGERVLGAWESYRVRTKFREFHEGLGVFLCNVLILVVRNVQLLKC